MMRNERWRALPLAAAMLIAGGCGGSDEEEEASRSEPTPPLIDLVVDANRNGRLDYGDPSEDEGEEEFTAAAGAIFLANLDDDDDDGRADALDDEIDGADDLRDLAPLAVRPWPEAPEGTTGLLAVEPADAIRLFRLNGEEGDPAAWSPVQEGALPLTAAELRAGVRLAVEGLRLRTSTDPDAWDGTVRLVLTVRSGSGAELGSDAVRMRVAPVIFQYNTAPTEAVYYSDGGSLNDDFAAGIAEMTEAALVPLVGLQIPGRAMDWDPWTQDFFDVGHTSMPGPDGAPIGMKIAVRSAQPDRRSGTIVDTHFFGPDWASLFLHEEHWDPNSHGYSMNSFGNWEVVPPWGDYPLGRNVWGSGDRAGERPDPVFVDFVRAQAVQPEIVLDTSWLAVGHVDEVFSWVHAETERGWRLLVADPTRAREMLLEMQAAGYGDARLFSGKRWIDYMTGREVAAEVSVAAILADPDLMAASQQAQLFTDEMLAKLVEETGLTTDEITPMPFLYEDFFGGLVAHQPGTVNLLHVDGRVVIPEPFGPVVDGVDVFRRDLEVRLAALGLEVYFTDNWDLYHRNLGEVHCGTNVSRRMELRWWESGR